MPAARRVTAHKLPAAPAKVVTDAAHVPAVRVFVPACSSAPDSGCLFCPLAPFHADFATFKARYQRKADTILARVKEPHVIKHRNVAEAWTPVDVLFVGDVATGDEDRKGVPFAGHAGSVLRSMLKDYVDADMTRFGFTHLVRCRTPLNRNVNKTDIKACSPELVREINARKPKLIVAMGNASLSFLTGQSGIVNLSGKPLVTDRSDIPTTDVLASVSPGYVIYADHMIDHFSENLGKVREYLAGKFTRKAGVGVVHCVETIADVRALFKDMLQQALVAFDTETGSLTPFQDKWPKLLCFSFSWEEGVAWVLPFDHADSPWQTNATTRRAARAERAEIVTLLREFFQSASILRIAQNEKFDRQHIAQALDMELGLTGTDTMNMHLTVDERRGTHGLKLLAYSATGMGGYEAPLDSYKAQHPDADPELGGSYANIPGSLLFIYAGYDADCTLRVYNWLSKQEEYANNPRLQVLSEVYFPQLSAALADMETTGACIDQAVVARLDARYKEDMRKAEELIQRDPEVVRYEKSRQLQESRFVFNPGSKPQLGEVFHSGYKLRPSELTDKGFDVLVARHKRLGEAQKERPPRFTDVVNDAIQKQEWELFKLDAETLHAFERLKNPLAHSVLDYRAASTLHSTFVTPLAHLPDYLGRIHGQFHIPGTQTGRLACVAAWTPVQTRRGLVPISQVVVGDEVWTHQGRYKRVSATILKGVEQMYQVSLSNGHILTCTAEHRVLNAQGGWISIQEVLNSISTAGGAECLPYIKGTGFDDCVTEAINECGSLQVYDLTVEEDHSYEAHGIFHHNSSNPNLQNIPNKGGGAIKQAYVSRFGNEGVLLNVDFSQIELRVAASWFNEPKMQQVYWDDKDLHELTAIIISGQPEAAFFASPKDIRKAWRTRAKRVNFGCVPMDTEILTSTGWKTYDNVCVGDLTLGEKNGRMVWTPVLEKMYYASAPVVTTSNAHFSVRTTPTHRWLASRRVDTGRGGRKWKRQFITTDEVSAEHRLTLSAPLLADDTSGLTPAQAELYAWILSDGSYQVHALTGRTAQGTDGRRRKVELSIFQSQTANPDKVAHLDALMAEFPHSRYVRRTGIVQWKLRATCARQQHAVMCFGDVSPETQVRRMGTEQVQRFLLGAQMAEGYGNVLTQNAGLTAEAFKLAGFLCGNFVSANVSGYYKDNISMKLRLRKPHVTGQRLQREASGVAPVWCVRTECQTWVMRQGGRTLLTGNSLYGGGPPALQTTLRKDGVFIELDECQTFLDKFFAGYPALRKGMDELEAFVCEHGYLESFTGRRRRVPEVYNTDRAIRARAIRQTVNFPIQSGAADMTLIALVLINNDLKKRKLRSRLILTVHDSLVFDCHVDEFLEVANVAKYYMENVSKHSESVLPGLDWSWLNVPIVAECEVGPNWGMMVEFDPAKFSQLTTNSTALFGLTDKGDRTLLRKPESIDELWDAFAYRLESGV